MPGLFDLHAHFPMHTKFPPGPLDDPLTPLKQALFATANLLVNEENGKHRMANDFVNAGIFAGFASVLYDPEDEFLVHPADSPRPRAFDHLRDQRDNAEAEAAKCNLQIATNPTQVETYLKIGQRFMLHAAEGGFALGGNPANVEKLAGLGVAYVIPAHLLYRGVSTCQNGIPNLSNDAFKLLNPQDPTVGLTKLGTDIVTALFDNKIIVDITHASDLAQQDIFNLASNYHAVPPLISSHNSVRARVPYDLNLSADAIKAIVRSKGVVGVIVSKYWLQPPGDVTDDLTLVTSAIDTIAEIAATVDPDHPYDYVCIGTDLDGFITPVAGCADYSQVGNIEIVIRSNYSGDIADGILWRNALSVLQRGWEGTP